jgi:hypothetical protein
MNSEASNLSSQTKSGPLHRVLRAGQWAIAASLGLVGYVTVYSLALELGAPGAPVALFWASFATFVIALGFLLPPVFFRLPKPGKAIAYLAFAFALLFYLYVGTAVSAAWERTPAGAKEAELRRSEEAAAAVAEDEREAAEAADRLRQARANAAAQLQQRLQNCISAWSGGIPALTEDVKNSLENPHAFEHVETKVIGPTPDGDNVEMTFRGQNAFGAIRTGWVRAQIDPDSCKLISRGPLYDE